MTSFAFSAVPFIAHARGRRDMLIAYALCPLLLAASTYGFWQWFDLPADQRIGLGRDEIFYLISLVVLPLILFLFLSVTTAQRLEHMKLSSGYQVRYDQLQKRLHHQEDLMQLIMNCHPESVTIFDKQNRYWFINQYGARELGSDANDIIGKSLTAIIGHERARRIEARLTEVHNTGRPIEAMEQMKDKDGRMHFIQMHYEPVEASGGFQGGAIMRGEDITGLIIERERRENMLRQVIGTLVAVVDRRDPYAAGHSARVGQLARGIAEELALDDKMIDASEIAGSLMNFGKVLVPREILTKTSPLTSDELQRVRDSILTSADILSIIDFTGPVVATLRQVQERYDGSGAPNNLKGDGIMMAARIVAVANAFVALVSPRAHRPSMEVHDALEHIMRNAGKAYDPRVVMALTAYLENRAAKLDWLTRTKQN